MEARTFGLLGVALVFVVMIALSFCAPAPVTPTQEPLATYTAAPPLPTLEPLATLEPLPTYTPFPTDIPPTLTPLPTATSTFIPPTPIPVFVKVLGDTPKLLLRQVCFNLHGFIYNGALFPVISDCIYPLKGEVSDRFIFGPGDKLEVEPLGDLVFAGVHGFQTHNGTIKIKADGGEQYYVAIQRGANGELLFIPAWLVKLLP